jgi:hypothetical protein
MVFFYREKPLTSYFGIDSEREMKKDRFSYLMKYHLGRWMLHRKLYKGYFL